MNAYSESVGEASYNQKEIIAQSAILINRSPSQNAEEASSTQGTIGALALSNILDRSSAQDSLIMYNNGEHVKMNLKGRDLTNNNSIVLLSRDPSLKKLKREKSISDASNYISNLVNNS